MNLQVVTCSHQAITSPLSEILCIQTANEVDPELRFDFEHDFAVGRGHLPLAELFDRIFEFTHIVASFDKRKHELPNSEIESRLDVGAIDIQKSTLDLEIL